MDTCDAIFDVRFPKKSEMREFGKVYNGTEEVYIKIRVELDSDCIIYVDAIDESNPNNNIFKHILNHINR